MDFLRRVLSSLSVLQPTISRPQTPTPDVPPEVLPPATIVRLGARSDGAFWVEVLRLESRWDGDMYKSIGDLLFPDAGIDLRRSLQIESRDGTLIALCIPLTEQSSESDTEEISGYIDPTGATPGWIDDKPIRLG